MALLIATSTFVHARYKGIMRVSVDVKTSNSESTVYSVGVHANPQYKQAYVRLKNNIVLKCTIAGNLVLESRDANSKATLIKIRLVSNQGERRKLIVWKNGKKFFHRFNRGDRSWFRHVLSELNSFAN